MAGRRKSEAFGRAKEPEPNDPITVMYISYDGTGVPMVPWETAGRKGKQVDGNSETREVKLGCVFTQTETDKKGPAVRDEASTSFVGVDQDCQIEWLKGWKTAKYDYHKVLG